MKVDVSITLTGQEVVEILQAHIAKEYGKKAELSALDVYNTSEHEWGEEYVIRTMTFKASE